MKLIIEDDEGRKTVVPFVRDEITIGRMEGNTIRLTERNVSRRHAKLLRQNGHVLIEDLGSYNGIRINGDRIAGQVQVSDGDLIQIGDYDLAIQAEDGPQRPANLPVGDATVRSAPVVSQVSAATARLFDPSTRLTETAATVPHLPIVDMPQAADDDVHDDLPPDDEGEGMVGDDAPPEMSRAASTAVIRSDQVEARKRQIIEVDPAEAPRLVVLNTELAGREFLCTRSEMKVGRTDDNDVPLDHRSLSRTHCKLVREDNGEWRVIDLQSANGLMVNGEPYAQATLRFGDLIELGHLKLQFVGPGEEVSLPTSASGDVSAPRTGSRAPLVALLVSVAVVVLGGGGYAFWKSQTPVPPKADPVKVEVKHDPAPVEPVAPVVDTHKTQELKMEEAKAAIASLDWDRAKVLLSEPPVAGEAKALLAQMESERGYYRALLQAREAIAAEDVDKVLTQLNAAQGTKLLKAELDSLDAERQRLVQARLKAAQSKALAPPPVAPPVVPENPKLKKADALLKEGRDALKRRSPDVAVSALEQCIKVAPNIPSTPTTTSTLANCYKVLGSAYAKLGQMEKGRAAYSRFVELAPDDAQAGQVKDYLESSKDPSPDQSQEKP